MRDRPSSSRCQICQHPERKEIEECIKAGVLRRAIIKDFGLGRWLGSISNHRLRHMSLEAVKKRKAPKKKGYESRKGGPRRLLHQPECPGFKSKPSFCQYCDLCDLVGGTWDCKEFFCLQQRGYQCEHGNECPCRQKEHDEEWEALFGRMLERRKRDDVGDRCRKKILWAVDCP